MGELLKGECHIRRGPGVIQDKRAVGLARWAPGKNNRPRQNPGEGTLNRHVTGVIGRKKCSTTRRGSLGGNNSRGAAGHL